MISQVLEETWDPDIASHIVEVAATVRQLADLPERLDETADAYDRLKPDTSWDAEAVERYLAAQEMLGVFISDDALAGTSAAQDLRNAYRQLPDQGPRGRILAWLDAMPLPVVRRVHALGSIDEDASSEERRDDLLLRLGCEQRPFKEKSSWQDDTEGWNQPR